MTTPTPEAIEAALSAYKAHLNTGSVAATLDSALAAAVTAAAPIITAQAKVEALREAADWLTEMASGYTRESPRLLAGREIISQLRARADHAEFMAKAAADSEGQRLADAAAALAGRGAVVVRGLAG